MSLKKIYPSIIFLSIVSILLSEYLLDWEAIIYNSYGSELVATSFLDSTAWKWATYTLASIFLSLKFFIISIVIYAGLFAYNYHKEISFTKMLNIVISCEVIFVLGGLIKTLYLLTIPNLDIETIKRFSPFALSNLLDLNSFEIWLLYPFQLINAFEALYILLISYLLAKELDTSIKSTLVLVMCSYGSAIFIWVLFVVFINLQLINQ